MENKVADIIRLVSLKHIAHIFFLGLIIIYSIIFIFPGQIDNIFLDTYPKAAFFVFLVDILLLFILIFLSLCFKKEPSTALFYSGIVLSCIILLPFWNQTGDDSLFYIPIIIVLCSQVSFFFILSKGNYINRILSIKYKILLLAFIIFYFVFFAYIGIQKVNNLSFFYSRDFAIYNQSFWNTIRGRFFENSTYGSNFACHNSWFFIILIPFYYILPNPLTLLILKILLLAFSSIPFYLIARRILNETSAIPLTLAFMAYPFLISQNFTPPHEITYAPFFILFTYYFFKVGKFFPFMFFLLVLVSIKEHLALVAIMFGFIALAHKKNPKWIIWPVALGIVWAVFSIGIISYFQKIYHSHPDAAWLLVNFKARLLRQNGGIFDKITSFIASSNMARWYKLKFALLLFTPLGVILPFLSNSCLFGLPEFLINLLSDRPVVFAPPWHYNIVVSCFLLIAASEGIKKISDCRWVKKLKIETDTFTLLVSVFIFFSVLMHSYSWLWLLKYKKDYIYAKTVKEAISIVPKEASITVPQKMAIQVSLRPRYSLIEDEIYADYLLIDKETALPEHKKDILLGYNQIFNKEGILLFKKK